MSLQIQKMKKERDELQNKKKKKTKEALIVGQMNDVEMMTS